MFGKTKEEKRLNILRAREKLQEFLVAQANAGHGAPHHGMRGRGYDR